MKAIAKLKDDARRFELREEWDRAIDAYLQVLRLAEQGDGSDLDLPLYNRVGDLYVRLGRPADAVTYYEQAADRYADAGLYNNAIALCNKALRYEPGRLPLFRKLGAFSAAQGFFTDARRWYVEFAEKAIKRGAVDDAFSALFDLAAATDDVEVRELLARQLRDHGRTDEALAEFRRAHGLRVGSGQHREAEALLAELRLLDPHFEPDPGGTPPAAATSLEASGAEWADESGAELPGFVDERRAQWDDHAPTDTEPAAETAGFDDHETFADLTTSRADHPESADGVVSMLGEAEPWPDEEEDGTDFDAGPIEVEVEEELKLFDLPYRREEGDADFEPRDPLGDEAFEAGDERELPLLDFSVDGHLDDAPSGDLPLLVPAEPAPAFDGFDDAEFGDYAPPPPRVFDFDDAGDEPDAEAEDAAAPEPVATGADDIEAEVVLEEEAAPGGPEPVAPMLLLGPPSPPAMEPDAPAPATPEPVVPEPVTPEPIARELITPEPVTAPVPPPVAPVRKDYVNLAALLGEEDAEEVRDTSTRFVVAEMPPSGDEEQDFADMLKQFKQKVSDGIPKEDAGSHYDLGLAFKEMGLIDEAIGEFQTALRSGQDKLKVYEELGSCFMLKKQYSVAVAVLSRAQEMPISDETEMLGVYYNLGRAHEELGQRAEARAAFERIVAVDIGFQDTTERLSRL